LPNPARIFFRRSPNRRCEHLILGAERGRRPIRRREGRSQYPYGVLSGGVGAAERGAELGGQGWGDCATGAKDRWKQKGHSDLARKLVIPRGRCLDSSPAMPGYRRSAPTAKGWSFTDSPMQTRRRPTHWRTFCFSALRSFRCNSLPTTSWKYCNDPGAVCAACWLAPPLPGFNPRILSVLVP